MRGEPSSVRVKRHREKIANLEDRVAPPAAGADRPFAATPNVPYVPNPPGQIASFDRIDALTNMGVVAVDGDVHPSDINHRLLTVDAEFSLPSTDAEEMFKHYLGNYYIDPATPGNYTSKRSGHRANLGLTEMLSVSPVGTFPHEWAKQYDFVASDPPAQPAWITYSHTHNDEIRTWGYQARSPAPFTRTNSLDASAQHLSPDVFNGPPQGLTNSLIDGLPMQCNVALGFDPTDGLTPRIVKAQRRFQTIPCEGPYGPAIFFCDIFGSKRGSVTRYYKVRWGLHDPYWLTLNLTGEDEQFTVGSTTWLGEGDPRAPLTGSSGTLPQEPLPWWLPVHFNDPFPPNDTYHNQITSPGSFAALTGLTWGLNAPLSGPYRVSGTVLVNLF